MKGDCRDFRAALEAELLGRPSQQKIAWLAWHGHLLSCGECRELLEKEEALETLLASLPEPRLPEALTRRVVLRLREERAAEVRLDDLLDLGLAGAPASPEGLARDILARLAPERGAGVARSAGRDLDALLDLDGRIAVPAGLAARILARLAPERAVRRRPARRSWVYATAAGLLAVLFGAWILAREHPARPAESELAVRDETSPDPRMLAALDVLEQWDLLMQDDLDVFLSTLGPADEALLDYR